MSVSGAFEVKLEPQTDDYAPAGRMVITKNYTGALIGTGIGQMLSKRTESGAAVYTAIEEFDGSLDNKKGTFTLIHNGYMSGETRRLDIRIVEGSGSGELQTISGELSITQKDGGHQYELSYRL